ncbi:hypothetical protein V3C99_001249 [Haemonchus contortus]
MSGESQSPAKCVEDSEATHSHKGSTSPLEKNANFSNMNSRRPGARHSSHYEPNLKSIYRCCDFTRPYASKEDTIVYFKRGEVGLAHVHKVDRKALDVSLYKGLISCQTLELETIPSCRRIRRLVEEVLVVDRGFSTGETVIKFENKHIGNPEKEDLCVPRSDVIIGQVVNVEVRGDVLVVPCKNLIVKNVSLGNNEYTEMVNYNSAHNYIMYKDWIGNASDCINDVTLLYRGRHRFVVKEGGRTGVFLCRQDRSDESKALVPGERVSIAISDALGRSATWEQKPPRTLTCARRRRATEGIKCVIEKIETNSLLVDWIMSPSSTTKPPKVIPKSEISRVSRVDPSANPRPSTCDRVKILPDDLSTVVTVKEYFAGLRDQYGSFFRKLLAKDDDSIPPSCENCSIPNQKEHEQRSPTAKAAKIARLSDDTTPQQGNEGDSVSAHSVAECEMMESKEDVTNDEEAWESSEESSDEDETPSKCGRSRVAVCRSVVRQKRMRKCPARRRRCTPALPSESPRLAKDILGNQFIGEVLLSHTLVDVQWMNGTIEEKIPGYLLIPHDPDLDQQDHLPGVIVARKDAQNAEAVFGLILSTNSAERSCKVSWFERRESEVKNLGEDECILFDIMAHPNYKRLFIGNYGVSIHHPSNDMRDIAFQVVADLKNGKQLVRFLNGTEEELWPFDILPIHFVDESLDSDSEDDDLSVTEGDLSKDSAVLSVILMEASNILRRLGLHSCKDHQVADQSKILELATRYAKTCPDLEPFFKESKPGDLEARNAKILFAEVMMEATGQQSSEYVEPLMRFADIIIAIYRSRVLPDNFDIRLLSSFVEDYELAKAFTANLHLPRDEMLPFLLEAECSARSRPEWLSIFHYVSECVCSNDKDSVRLPLRSPQYQHKHAADFRARHLSWEYVDSIAEDVRIAHEVCDRESSQEPFKMDNDSITDEVPSLNKPPSITVDVKGSAHDLATVLQQTPFTISVIEQLLNCDTWPLEEVKIVARKDIACEDSKSKESREVLIKRTFASALVLLHRCGLVSYNSLCKGSLWDGLNHVFDMNYETPRLIKYPTLHEIIMFARSVDYHYPSMILRLMDVTQAYSLDSIHLQVKRTCGEKLGAAGDTHEMNCDLHEVEFSVKGEAGGQQAKHCAGTFEILDEYPERNELVDGLPSRKFYSAVFKEHKVLSENVPDSIHVHAFADRLNILHVLIIGPTGTPFDTTPFFFKFKLPADYPQKPPEVTYVAYSQEQLNPNLYQNGKVCTSLLGTWSGQGVETWNPAKSNIFQVLLSIQALILVPEPYFNEAGYESRKQQSEMSDRSRRYNETATINSLEYLLKVYLEPPGDFKELIKSFVEKSWIELRQRINGWINGTADPSFPVMGSKGFKMALKKAVDRLDAAIKPCAMDEEGQDEPMDLTTGNESTSKVVDEERNERIYEWTIKAEMKPTSH